MANVEVTVVQKLRKFEEQGTGKNKKYIIKICK
jgi:hypothetical protein